MALAALLGAAVTPWALLGLAAYPVQVARLAPREGWARAAALTFGKIAEAQGVLTFLWRRMRGTEGRLIEYK
jgi:hypothetical protein